MGKGSLDQPLTIIEYAFNPECVHIVTIHDKLTLLDFADTTSGTPEDHIDFRYTGEPVGYRASRIS